MKRAVTRARARCQGQLGKAHLLHLFVESRQCDEMKKATYQEFPSVLFPFCSAKR